MLEQRCRCGDELKYPEEKHSNLCWCCASQKGLDIGATYYYDTGIWTRNPRFKERKNFRRAARPPQKGLNT